MNLNLSLIAIAVLLVSACASGPFSSERSSSAGNTAAQSDDSSRNARYPYSPPYP